LPLSRRSQTIFLAVGERERVAKKTKAAKPYQIFVSHATADKWIAVTICEKLEEAGARTFRDDRDIDGGDDIPERIRSEIKRSREVVVLLTPNSVNRPWVLLEVGAAWGWSKAIRITPVLCHVDIDPIPGMLKSKKAIHINDLADLLAEVKRRVKNVHD
jgi:TIR domain